MSFKNVLKILFFISIFLFVSSSVFAGTFGYQGEPRLTPDTHISDAITGSLFYLSEKAEIQSMSAWLNFSGNASTTAGIYNNAGDLVATTNIDINTGGAIGQALITYTFSVNPILEIGNYWLVVWGNTPDVFCYTEEMTILETYMIPGIFDGILPSIFEGTFWRAFENSAIYATYDIYEEPEEPFVYLEIPTNFPNQTLAYAGQLFTDLTPVIILTIGLPLGFWVIKKIISLVRAR